MVPSYVPSCSPSYVRGSSQVVRRTNLESDDMYVRIIIYQYVVPHVVVRRYYQQQVYGLRRRVYIPGIPAESVYVGLIRSSEFTRKTKSGRKKRNRREPGVFFLRAAACLQALFYYNAGNISVV